jgi:fumarate reductase flavoprotein subunit
LFNKKDCKKKNEEQETSGNVSRRDFLVGSGTVIAVGAIGSGMLAGCKGETTTVVSTVEKTKTVPTTIEVTKTASGGASTVTETKTVTGASGGTVTTTKTVTQTGAKWSWEAGPPTIPANQITETVDVDYVVVGGGTGGSVGAAAAAKLGMKTVLLNKDEVQAAPRMLLGAFTNSQRARAAGSAYKDPEETAWSTLQNSRGLGELPLQRALYKYGGPADDFIMEVMEDQGVVISGAILGDVERATSRNYGFFDAMRHYGEKFDYEYRGGTSAVQLIRANNNKGRVTGVIAKKPDGSYVQFNTAKGVCLASGDVFGDEEMVERFCPSMIGVMSLYFPGGNTGDMQKAAYWIGAECADWAGQSIIHFNTTNLQPPINHNQVFEVGVIKQKAGVAKAPATTGGQIEYVHRGDDFGTQCGQLLYVNKVGQRVGYEIGSQENFAGQVFAQPGKTSYALFCNSDIIDQEKCDAKIATGEVVQGDTIAALAAKLGANASILQSTIDRYNGWVDAGYDEDYHKDEWNLFPLREGPFYACEQPPNVLNAPAMGPRLNEDAEVLDAETHLPIGGLYVAGHCMGTVMSDPALYHCSTDGAPPSIFNWIAAHHAAGVSLPEAIPW